MYPYFARTIPSDIYQARAIVDLMSKFHWSYVTVISSLGSYGESGGEVTYNYILLIIYIYIYIK